MSQDKRTDAPNKYCEQVVICNEKGLHARASALFVKCARQFEAEINVTREGETVSGSSIMDLLMLAAAKGTKISIEASGPDADQAVAALLELVKARFHEET